MKLYQALTLMALASPAIASADDFEYRLNIGLFTEHYLGREGELNENNDLVQVSVVKDKNAVTAASFVNSHFQQSYLVGYGYEETYLNGLRVGGYISAVHGYEGYLETHFEGLLFAPVAVASYYGATLSVMPAVYVLGYEFKF